ncbi:hypothetical protein CHU94_08980 [Rhodoferax sp. TH121]|nr:hypothetical protein CHU94_08980 [Rhodoferax sp. TH121]
MEEVEGISKQMVFLLFSNEEKRNTIRHQAPVNIFHFLHFFVVGEGATGWINSQCDVNSMLIVLFR